MHGIGSVAHQAKLLPVSIGIPVHVAPGHVPTAPLPYPASHLWPGKEAEDGTGPWAPETYMETCKRFLALGFRRTQLPPLWPFRMNQSVLALSISLSLLHSVHGPSNKNKCFKI